MVSLVYYTSLEGKESPDCQEGGFVFTNESASSPEAIVSLLRRCMASPNGGMLYQIVEKHEETCHGIKYCGPDSDPERFINIVRDLDPQCGKCSVACHVAIKC